MFSRLLGLNVWLQTTCSIKGVNFNIFCGHRQRFKLDGLHPNKLGARVLKDNICFSLRHPSVVCANPLDLKGTHTHLERIWVTTGLHISFRVIMWLTHPTRTLITPCSQNNNCSWKLALPTELITDRLWHNTTAPRLSTQGQLSGEQPGKPGQHITATGNTRDRAHPRWRHIIPLSSISTSKLLTENGGTGVCWDQTLPLLRCKPPDINKKTVGLTTTKDCRPSSPSSTCERCGKRPGSKPFICCRWTKTTDNSSQWYVSGPHCISSNIHKCLQNKREPSVLVASSISVLSRDRKSKAFSSRTCDDTSDGVGSICSFIRMVKQERVNHQQ